MPSTADLIVRNGTVVTPGEILLADLAITDGRFVAIGRHGSLGLQGRDEIDATGLHVLPGVIDGHVHFREPGLEHKEDWGTGSAAAAAGGVTTVIDMPNTNPRTDSVEAFELKRRLAEEKSLVDFGIIGLFGQDNLTALPALADAGVVGFKCFLGETTGNIAPPDDGTMLEGMADIAGLGMRLGVHAENGEILRHLGARLRAEGRTDPLAHVDSRPAIAEAESIQRMALYAARSGTKLHVFHLSSREGLGVIERWREQGVDLTCELTPHHAFLAAEEMATLGSRLRINPPVRYGRDGHREALLAALADGRIDMIGTDHAPHTEQEKLHDDIWQAVSGFPGVETSVRLFLTHAVNAGRMRLQSYVRATSEGPARTWGLYPRKGAIRIGSDGDLTIVDLERRGVIRDADLHSRSRVTPYDGRPTVGAPVGTVVRGRIVMREGELLGAPSGRMVSRARDERRAAASPA